MHDSAPSTPAPVSVICPNLSENCLGRAAVLGGLLAADRRVQILGPQLGDAIWPAVRSSSVPVIARRVRHVGDLPAAVRWLRERVLGTQVIVSKPLPTSLGLALFAGIPRDQLLLDIDDWELGFFSGGDWWRRWGLRVRRGLSELADPHRLNSRFSVLVLDRLASTCPHRLVSNRWLAERFDAPILSHVRDTLWLDPDRIDGPTLRRRFALGSRPWVGFIGTVRSHKGIEDLVQALARVRTDPAPGLFLAGLDQDNAIAVSVGRGALAALGADRVRIVGPFPFDDLPAHVGAPDLVCIPSRAGPAGVGQIPAKLFDAMAMAKPVIASGVNDLATILEGCGVVTPPGDVDALAAAITDLCRSPVRRSELGRAARRRAMERFSFDFGRELLARRLQEITIFGAAGR